jgi:lipopolysaccharide transport system ATP-binding protein
VEKFIDTPVKFYSSGMYVRLAFAVAAHLEPEILLVDEVLAVGDAAFQKKCLGKMGEVAKQGRTVLFVSHNMQAISTLTDNCALLSSGRCVSQGSTNEVISVYLREGCSDSLVYTAPPSSSEPRITRVALQTSEPANTQICGQPLEVQLEITAPGPVDGASISFQARNSLFQPVLHLWTFDSERPVCREAGVFRLVCRIPRLRLYMGRYTLVVHFSERAGGRKFQTIEDICPFEVVMFGKQREFEWVSGTCTYMEDCEWTIDKMSS